jgi:hypothetical protein
VQLRLSSLRHSLPLAARLRETNGDGLFADFDLPAAAALEGPALSPAHRTPDILGGGLGITSHLRNSVSLPLQTIQPSFGFLAIGCYSACGCNLIYPEGVASHRSRLREMTRLLGLSSPLKAPWVARCQPGGGEDRIKAYAVHSPWAFCVGTRTVKTAFRLSAVLQRSDHAVCHYPHPRSRSSLSRNSFESVSLAAN